jgi:hypothetical protein
MMTMAQAAPDPCADNGYTCADEVSNFTHVSSFLGNGSDSDFLISLPFTFKFYGRDYNEADVSTNGIINFFGPTGLGQNHEITDPATPSASIMPFWDELYMGGIPGATLQNVDMETRGTPEDPQLVIEWNYALIMNDQSHVSIQAILHKNGDIVFQYADTNFSTDSDGAGATIGIKDHTGDNGIQYSYNVPVVRDSLAIRFTPRPPTPADTAGPQITITTPPNGAVYQLNQVVNADYGCTDPSGVATCNGPVATNQAIDTSSVGNHNFHVSATDTSGNASDLTNAYSVDYNFSGFFPPVDISTGLDRILNQTKAGSSVPVKFSLGGNQGLNIFFQDYPSSKAVLCSDGTSIDPLKETAAAGSSGLSYDPTTDQYNYVWKTDKAWASTCRLLVLKLMDGTEHRAYFSFTK